MQEEISAADLEKCRRIGVEEQFIKFRSSPNFKNMKKFIKHKMNPTASQDPTENATTSVENVQPIQPPLPLEPPPPDSPADIKQEIEDTDDLELQLEDSQEDETETNNSEQLITEFKTDASEPERPRTICRDYIRGTCSRPGTCKFSHEYDISQLVGVYTFCRDYQNSICTHPNCKYVHASVFEEQRWYRSGIFPPNGLAHQKKNNPPPPPSEPPEELTIPVDFSHPPPSLPPTLVKPPFMGPLPTSNLEWRPNDKDPRSLLPSTASSSRMSWPAIEHEELIAPVASSAHEREPSEMAKSKKCNECEIMEFRLQYYKEKVEKSVSATEEINQKINNLNKKHQKLMTILMTLLKPQQNKVTASGSNSAINTRNDKDQQQVLIDSLINTIVNSNTNSANRVATGMVSDDVNKGAANNAAALKNLMAMVLQCSNENSGSTEPGRET